MTHKVRQLLLFGKTFSNVVKENSVSGKIRIVTFFVAITVLFPSGAAFAAPSGSSRAAIQAFRGELAHWGFAPEEQTKLVEVVRADPRARGKALHVESVETLERQQIQLHQNMVPVGICTGVARAVSVTTVGLFTSGSAQCSGTGWKQAVALIGIYNFYYGEMAPPAETLIPAGDQSLHPMATAATCVSARTSKIGDDFPLYAPPAPFHSVVEIEATPQEGVVVSTVPATSPPKSLKCYPTVYAGEVKKP